MNIYTLVLDRDLVHDSKIPFALKYCTIDSNFLGFIVLQNQDSVSELLEKDLCNLLKYVLKEIEGLKGDCF